MIYSATICTLAQSLRSLTRFNRSVKKREGEGGGGGKGTPKIDYTVCAALPGISMSQFGMDHLKMKYFKYFSQLV